MEKLHIVKAENAGNLTVNLTFSDNTTQLVDVGDFIRRHPRQCSMGQELGLDIPDRTITLRCNSIIVEPNFTTTSIIVINLSPS